MKETINSDIEEIQTTDEQSPLLSNNMSFDILSLTKKERKQRIIRMVKKQYFIFTTNFYGSKNCRSDWRSERCTFVLL